MDMGEMISKGVMTQFTKITRHSPYPTISPTRSELTQAGKTILITGGGTGVGFAIAQAFIHASAATVIINGRRAEVLETARTKLQNEAAAADKPATVLVKVCDIADKTAVDALWGSMHDEGIVVDVLVLNAGHFGQHVPILEEGVDATWEAYEGNVRAPLMMTTWFNKQEANVNKQKFLIHISTGAINGAFDFPVPIVSPSYAATKNAGTMLMQVIAKDVTPEKLQIVSFHPGLLYSDGWKAMGITERGIPFDSFDVPGSFAVWASTKEAGFLHGRFVWASWDVDEYSTGSIRKRIEEEPEFLRIGLVGERLGKRVPWSRLPISDCSAPLAESTEAGQSDSALGLQHRTQQASLGIGHFTDKVTSSS